MQIADIARQYVNATTSGEAMSGTRGVEKLVSSIRDLTAGNIFEGTVNSISGGKVVLGLSNGMELSARLDANMQLIKGQSMFFQVKSNDGATIAIRPYTTDGAGVNLTLLNALKAAGLPVAEKYINMANQMMQEQMPIDKNSLAQMARILMANPDMSVNTAVQMKKLQLPITNEMVAQFENYMDDTSAVHKALDRFITELPSTLLDKGMSLEQMKAFDSQLLQILAEGMEHGQEMMVKPESVAGQEIPVSQDSIVSQAVTEKPEGATISQNEDVHIEQPMQLEELLDVERSVTTSSENQVIEMSAETTSINGKSEGVVSDVQEQAVKLLQNLFGEAEFSIEDTPAKLLNRLSTLIMNTDNISKETLFELFSSKDVQTFLREVLEQQMYLKPEEVADGEKIKKLYERLESKTQKLEQLLMSAGIKDTPLAQTVADVRGNIDFMHQLNQTYTYVQIPLKMSGQNASGQLYVYTNKRDLGDSDRELTAFLHLDMDYLGSTDVSVRLLRKDVDTKFYMDSDEAYALIKAHMPELEARLKKKGFNASIYVENEGKKVNFVEDFLKKDAPSAGQLHRYSFDVRA